MLKRGWFGGVWKPKNPHSLDHLRYLYTVLSKNQTVQDSNRSLLVETLRSIAEILIWGDQNDSSVFDFFLEKNMLSFFLKIMKQKCGSYVCVQLLQTLNILFENIRNETSLYYLLSNNHVNSIIVHKFDFSDEEVMAYYISFLKTLSLKLNSHTIHFFYNEHTNDFPLYTEAIKFFNHPESMVRIAVRTLTLNVYKVEDESMQQFIRDKTAAPYFSNLVWFIGNHILELDACIRTDIDHTSRDRLADLVAEHLDHLHYLNDILRLDITKLNHVLADHLLNRLLVPLLVYSLNHHLQTDDRPRVSRVVALFLLAQVFLIFSFSPLMQVLAKIILHGDNSIFADNSPCVEGDIKLRPGFVAPTETLEKSLRAHSQSGSGCESQEEYETESQRSYGVSGTESQISELDTGSQLSCDGAQSQAADFKGATELSGGEAETQPSSYEPLNSYNEPSFDAPETPHQFETTENLSSESDNKNACEPIEKLVPNISLHSKNSLQIGISELEATHVNITDEEKEQLKYSDGASNLASPIENIGVQEVPLSSSPFLKSVLEALNCQENDYSALFSLCLLYAIGHNSGINKELIYSSLGQTDAQSPKIYYNTQLVDLLLTIISHSAQYNSKIRVATLEMTLNVLSHLIGLADTSTPPSCQFISSSTAVKNSSDAPPKSCTSAFLRDQHLAALEGAKEEATLLLRNFYKGEEIFLDMFEDEWRELHRKPLNVEYLLQDASILLPPAGTPLTGIDFNKRLPCGDVERAKRSMRVFFLIRSMGLMVKGDADPHLPLTNPAACVQIADVLDLNNSDLIACVVITREGARTRRFLVIDIIQLILVEPDPRKLGWGVAKFVGFLQDLEVVGDKDDSRVLHITIHRPSVASMVTRRPASPLLAAKFIFDDHIRCMAAKQRLTKGRLKARQRKLHQIARLLDMPSNLQPCPSPPAHALSTMRQEAQRRGSRSDLRSRSLFNRPKFNPSSRGPGVAFKRDGTSADEVQGGASNDASVLDYPGGGQRRSTSRSASRSSSRPRPRSEEIPLENMSSSPNKVPSPDAPQCRRSPKRLLVPMEAIKVPGSAIPVYRVAEQVPFSLGGSSVPVSHVNLSNPLNRFSVGDLPVAPKVPLPGQPSSNLKSKKRNSSTSRISSHKGIPPEDVPATRSSPLMCRKIISNERCPDSSPERSKNKVPPSDGNVVEEDDSENETSFCSKPGKTCTKSSSFDVFEHSAALKSRVCPSTTDKELSEAQSPVSENNSSAIEEPEAKREDKDLSSFSPIKKIKDTGKVEII